MSEWLTTGQMVDRLKVGEVAEGVDGFYKGTQLTKNDYREICIVKDGVEQQIFVLNHFHSKAKWRILPKYVTFEEAMKALKNDREVWFHRKNGKPFIFKANDYFTFRIEHLPFGFFTMHELFEGKWQIIE